MDFMLRLNNFRKYVGDLCRARLNRIYGPDSYFADEIFRRIDKGRKTRSLLFVETARSLERKLDEDTIADVCLSIELPHAASILVDDILDGDDTRHGYTSSQVSIGTPLSALESHHLCAEALRIASGYPRLLDALVEAYRKTATGELYDVLAVEPLDEWILNGYGENVFQKTSSLFEYTMAAAALVSDWSEIAPKLAKVGTSIGKVYQMANDYFDWQSRNLRKRHVRTDNWRLTFSFPLALYIQHFGTENISEIIRKRMLTFEEWCVLLDKIWTPELQKDARRELQKACREVVALANGSPLPAPARDAVQALTGIILKEDFWYHSVQPMARMNEEAEKKTPASS